MSDSERMVRDLALTCLVMMGAILILELVLTAWSQ